VSDSPPSGKPSFSPVEVRAHTRLLRRRVAANSALGGREPEKFPEWIDD
jgi:hypothetical protein